MKKIILIIFLCIAYQSQGQVFSETALRFGQSTFGGTARFQGLAGAATALGGDISNAANNPAGLGFMRKGQLSLSPTLSFSGANSTLFGEETNFSNTGFNLNQFGIVLTNGEGGSQRGTFAITYTKLNDFNSSFKYEANNPQNSLVDFLLQEADLNIPYDALFDQADFGFVDIFGLSFNNYLINPDYRDTLPECGGVCTDTYSAVRYEPVRQSEEINRSGSHHEWDFAYGWHINNRVYLGLSLGVQSIRYEETKTYREQVVQGLYEFDNLEFTEQLDLRGTGANLEIGAIIRASDRFRIGLTATSPTFIRINDLYSASLSTNYVTDTLAVFFEKQIGTEFLEFEIVYDDILRNNFSETPVLEADYTIMTPYRLKGGLAFFLGKKGFLSADVEYVGYKATRLRNPEPVDLDVESENEFIQLAYKNAFNIRLGGEMRVKDFRLRAGAAYYGHPSIVEGENNPQLIFTAGAGYRNKKYFADIALVGQTNQFTYSPYQVANTTPVVDVSQSNLRTTITVGTFF